MPNVPRRGIAGLLALIYSAAIQGCSSTAPNGPDSNALCPDIAFAAVLAEVRDQDGRGAALATRLEVEDGSFRQVVVGAWDTLTVGAASNRAGNYTVRLSRPGYASVTRQNVNVPGGLCGALSQVRVPVVLQLLPNAPPVRSVSIIPTDAGIGRGYSFQYQVYVDAARGVDSSVTWSLSDTTVATISPAGFLRVKCTAPIREILVIARSNGDKRVTAQARLTAMATGYLCP